MTLREYRRTVLRQTLEAVAARAGIDLSVISRLERSGKANPYRVPDFAKGYQIGVAEFETMLGDNHETNKPSVRNAQRVSGAGNRTPAKRSRTPRKVASGQMRIAAQVDVGAVAEGP